MMRRFKLARDVATKTAWNHPSIWSVDHPLNRLGYVGTGVNGDKEQIENDFEGYVNKVYKANGPVFSCITARQYVFSQIRFKFRSLQDGKLFGSPELALLEKPWPGGTTADLLSKMEVDASGAGNSWWTLANDEGQFGNAARGGTNVRVAHMRPDWVQMIVGSKSKDPFALDAKLVGVLYSPRIIGATSNKAPDVLLTMDEVVHYSPIPDPIARFRGMSWITPILPEVQSDKGATEHKKNFFENAAVPNISVSFDKDTNEDDFDEFVEKFKYKHQGAWNAYKTLFLMGGADVKPLTHDFRAMDFSQVIGKGESRIASAAGVPPSWVGFSEGMQGSALNSGNMLANRRRFADGTIKPLWEFAVNALSVLVKVPDGAELWYDESRVAFLHEDQRDRAEIMRIDMNAVDSGIKAGYEPDACVEAVHTNDIRKLIGKHTGLVSVQMQPAVLAEEQGAEQQAKLNSIVAGIIATLSGHFDPESVAKAVAEDGTFDPGKLKNKPEPPPPVVAPKPLNGQAKPPKPGTTNPGGGENGRQAVR